MDLDISLFAAEDTADWHVPHPVTGGPTTWVWTFAGPGHPQTVEAANKAIARRLREEKLREQAQVNGRKWTAEDRTPETVRAENVRLVTDRLLGWSPIKINGADFPFSLENATTLLSDPKMGRLFNGAIAFLGDDAAFTKRSAAT